MLGGKTLGEPTVESTGGGWRDSPAPVKFADTHGNIRVPDNYADGRANMGVAAKSTAGGLLDRRRSVYSGEVCVVGVLWNSPPPSQSAGADRESHRRPGQ